MSKSINEQISAAVAAGGGQSAVARAIKANGGSVNRPMLTRLCGWQTPSLATLAAISRAVDGWTFVIDGETDIGTSRPPGPADHKERTSK